MNIIRYRDLKESKTAIPEDVEKRVKKILQDIKNNGDAPVKNYTYKYDRVTLKAFRIAKREIVNAKNDLSLETIRSIKKAMANIGRFSEKQLKQIKNFTTEIALGACASQRVVPIERVGIYVPGGTYPLVSTVLMLVVPAKVAGVKEIVLCSPPTYNNTIRPAILAAAGMIGIDEIYKIGGAQAIAALAYGTKTVKRVDKIFGPGNVYVTAAKKLVYGDVGIDFIAGPSEVLIIADESADYRFVAADLIAQAEHDKNAIPILVTTSRVTARMVRNEIARQLKGLPTRKTAEISLKKNGLIILVTNIDQAVEIANKKAPEHLELQIKNPSRYVKYLKNYGSLFIGPYSAEVLGDYCAGINHTLPTNSAARYTGGLHVKDFLKLQTVLHVTKKGLKNIGPIAEELSNLEGLYGHKRSVSIRLLPS